MLPSPYIENRAVHIPGLRLGVLFLATSEPPQPTAATALPVLLTCVTPSSVRLEPFMTVLVPSNITLLADTTD